MSSGRLSAPCIPIVSKGLAKAWRSAEQALPALEICALTASRADLAKHMVCRATYKEHTRDRTSSTAVQLCATCRTGRHAHAALIFAHMTPDNQT